MKRTSLNRRAAISKINRAGALLVFPLENRPEPPSLWSGFFPRKKMRWEWADEGDTDMWSMWGMMKELSDCREVVYSKWYKGRATFLSRTLFTAMLARMRRQPGHKAGLESDAALVFEILENNSPLSTRQLKKFAELQGRENEGTYNRALKALFTRLLIIVYGEVDEGSFPSLAIGSTRLLYEDLWNEAEEMSDRAAGRIIDQHLPEGSDFRRFFDQALSSVTRRPPRR